MNSLNLNARHTIAVGIATMIPLRIAFDMDGTLADFSAAYADIEARLFGAAEASHDSEAAEAREVEQHSDGAAIPAADEPPAATPRPSQRRTSANRDLIWKTIESTPNFWTGLRPLEQ